MFRFKIFTVLLVAILCLFALNSKLFALADVPNKTISVIEGANEVTFYGTASFAVTDSTSSLFTQAMSGDGWLDWENALLTVHCLAAGGEDVNVFVRGGSTLDLTYITSIYTQTVWDDVNSATPVHWFAMKDTLIQGAAQSTFDWFVDPTAYARFIVIEFDGQAGNVSTNIITWSLVVKKKPGAPKRNAYGIFDTT